MDIDKLKREAYEAGVILQGTPTEMAAFAHRLAALAAHPAVAVQAEPASDARTHDVEVAFEHFKAWPCVTSINNLRMKLDEAEAYINLLAKVKTL